MNERVDILMATYNGQAYLRQQIDSIVKQTYRNWMLIIRDDGSNDNSGVIINEYIEKYPEKISLLKSDENIGSCNNFFRLIENSKADYIMFSDQDDVWFNDKIEKTLKKFISIENEYGKKMPILLHTDLKVTGDKLEIISDSFWKFQQMDVEGGIVLNKILLQNIVTGCTIMINNSLKMKALPLPTNVFVHDWWLALLASGFGKIEKMQESTMLYRQHKQNLAGAKKSSLIHFYNRLFHLDEVRKGLENAVFQANIFYNQYHNDFTSEQEKTILSFCNLFKYNYLKRRWVLIHYGLLKSTLIRNIGLFIVA